VALLQILTHASAVPAIASQIDASGHSPVDPDVVHDVLQ